MTYVPLAEIVGQLGDARVAELLDGDETVLAAIGAAERTVQSEEIFWAVRRMFERLASERPLVVVFEDLHWAEPTLLDLIEYLEAFASAHPILLVCLARPELLETRPAWGAVRPTRSLLVLDALSEDESRRLVENAAPGELGSGAAARIVETAEGNPLFLEQLVAVGTETGTATLPTSIQAVLAARIDRLEPGERAVLEEASVQGRSFYVGALEAPAASHLVSLVNRQLIGPERAELAGQDAFRFAHVLIREAAYRRLPRQRRAELHEHVAGWLGALPGAHDETVGHHLAEAYRQRAELGRPDRELARAAAERLATAADASLLRGDPSAGARLLERAAALADPRRRAAAGARRRAVRGRPHGGRRARARRGDRVGAGAAPAGARAGGARARAARDRGERRDRPGGTGRGCRVAPARGRRLRAGPACGCCAAWSPGTRAAWSGRTRPSAARPRPCGAPAAGASSSRSSAGARPRPRSARRRSTRRSAAARRTASSSAPARSPPPRRSTRSRCCTR